jgi:hypothetical protein
VGGLFFASKEKTAHWSEAVAASRDQFRRAGFSEPMTFETTESVLDYYPKINFPFSNCARLDSGDFAITVGTFLYRGRIGDAALRLFHAEPDPLTAIAETRGHFILVLRKGADILLLRDPGASQELLIDPEIGCVSSSFLALARAAAGRRINAQEVYEYVFNGATLGSATVLAGLRRVDVNEWLRLAPRLETSHQPRPLCPPERVGSRADLVERNVDGLLTYARELAALFGDNIRQALSGGYDSRFLLALFRHVGVNPWLFVYGSATDEDVLMAKRIAAGEGLQLHHVDKSRLCPTTPETFPETVADNFDKNDGLPWAGIFQSGAELLARAERCAGGALHVNGGGGEIFRNFFNLPDRPVSAREFVWVFYSQFDPTSGGDRFDRRAYDEAIARKVTGLLGIVSGRLARREVECLYPYLRCRSWFAPENSINSRYGFSVLPFFDHRIIDEALRVPVRYKHFGNFEAAMIRRADPSLAAQPSNYGHGFDRDTPLSAAARSLAFEYLRPFWLRRNAFRIKQRLHGRAPPPELLSPNFANRVLSPGFPYMSRYFDICRVSSRPQLERLYTLEYLFQQLNVHEP